MIRNFFHFVMLVLLGWLVFGIVAEKVGYGAPAPRFDRSRTLFLTGGVGYNAIELATEIDKLSASSKEPIYMVINSPGGSIDTGLVMLNAMTTAKSRGVKFTCVTPIMAASMAFAVYAHCDVRYAFRFSYLLWHEATVRAEATALQLADILAELVAFETPLKNDLIDALVNAGMTRLDALAYYKKGTLWLAADLAKGAPKFLTIVADVHGLRPGELYGDAN